MTTSTPQTSRCAIYTRKSSENGLEHSFNSLHAQREACEAYIKSKAHEGWKLRPTHYDDGGLSGGTMDRPALHQLLSDIASGLIDVVVVYKVDRLSRSLADFARLVELFEQHEVSFVSVTQHFNTSSSMGRLTLNVLLSFAQFEREVTGERIRDKIAASKKKGLWMGGRLPLGYDAVDRHLVVNQVEAETIRHIYQRYLALGCVRRLKGELDEDGYVSKIQNNGDGGKSFSRGALYTLLRNPIYIGKVSHKKKVYPGQHDAIVDEQLWNDVQEQLKNNRSKARSRSAAKAPSLLAGLLFDSNGNPMSPTHATKGKKRYRYYISQAVLKFENHREPDVQRVPATSIESVVIDQLKYTLRDARLIAQAAQALDIQGEQLERVLALATKFAGNVNELSAGKKIDLLNQVLCRAVLARETVESHISLAELIAVVTAGVGNKSPTDSRGMPAHIVKSPVRLKRCGVETRLIIGNAVAPAAHADSIKAIRSALKNALRWNQALLEGKASTLTELAGRENYDVRYLVDLIHLAYLAPDIQSTILRGDIPVDLTLDKLKKRLPESWDAQRQLLGIS
jgi:DNA invertase Pin-like site-specific DNA recombinase